MAINCICLPLRSLARGAVFTRIPWSPVSASLCAGANLPVVVSLSEGESFAGGGFRHRVDLVFLGCDIVEVKNLY